MLLSFFMVDNMLLIKKMIKRLPQLAPFAEKVIMVQILVAIVVDIFNKQKPKANKRVVSTQ